MLACAPALATTISDPANDFLPTYVGPHDGDLDALSVTADLVGSNFLISATLDGPIGVTPGSEYVFGVNTGGATALFAPFETGVLFNSVIVLSNATNSSGQVVAGLTTPGGPMVSALSSVTVSRDTISAVVPVADLPSTGLAPGQYGFNLWPRLDNPQAGQSAFSAIADFAPDNSTFAAVPEPASWTLMMLGVGGLGAALRAGRRRPMPATA